MGQREKGDHGNRRETKGKGKEKEGLEWKSKRKKENGNRREKGGRNRERKDMGGEGI